MELKDIYDVIWGMKKNLNIYESLSLLSTHLVAVEQVQDELQERADQECDDDSPEVPESSLVTLHLLLSWSNCVQ